MDEFQQIKLFKRIGLKENKAQDTAKNKVLAKRFEFIINKTERDIIKNKIDPARGMLLYCASSYSFNDNQLNRIINMICDKKMTSGTQIRAAAEFFKRNPKQEIDERALEAACGVGVSYNESAIEAVIIAALSKYKFSGTDTSEIKRGPIIGSVVKDFKWVDINLVNDLIDRNLNKVKFNSEYIDTKDCKNSFTDWKSVMDAIDPKKIYTCGEAAKFHIPGENFTSPNYIITENTETLMSQHLTKFGNKVRTRFPPEPNGILHIGHAKAINFNFGYAKACSGVTYLRYDDTNPEKEEEKFFQSILEMIEWLGFSPYAVTYSSDNFDILYQFAQKLIKKGLAYICHQPPEMLKGRDVKLSPWRERPVHESLQLFEDMKNGKFDEEKATLRLKYIMEDGKIDPVIYRILYTAHHRTGTRWCIYPTYSFTHPICDSLEGITHSLCTKEFQNQRSFYYWLCNSLDIYCPVQWEYSRLNLSYAVMSKRKILKLVEEKIVNNWDDPRLFTLTALRRRGVPPEAINYFCSKVGVTMSNNTFNPTVLYSCIREVLNIKAKRVMAVLTPIKVKIINLDKNINLSVPNFPFDPSLGSRELTFGPEIYIDSCDFEDTPKDDDFRRLTLTQSVGLMHVNYVLNTVEVVMNGEKIDHLVCNIKEVTPSTRPRAFIQWVHEGTFCNVRTYNELFIHANPDETEGGFLNDINQDSIKLYENCLVEKSICNAKPLSNYQFERIGYFCVDTNINDKKIIFNRTVQLK